MKKPEVTIITTAYNHEPFIAKCIESVLSQDYKSWEQIIVDDASTDKTYSIAASYARRDKRIKIFRHKKDWGIENLADTYNHALRKARGKYIAILESDDFWPKDKLKKQLKGFKDEKVVFTYGNCILINKSGFPINIFTYSDDVKSLNNRPTGSILRLFYNLKFVVIPVTVMIRKRNLLKMGGFKKDKIYPFTDIPTFINMALQGRFCFVNEILGYYRKQQNSYWFDFASKTSAMGRDEVRRCIKNFLKANRDNLVVKNIYKNDKNLIQSQQKFIIMKRFTKPISLLVNNLAFGGSVSPMTIIFVFKYLSYKIKKFLR